MVLGGGAFGRCLSHEGGAFMNGISALKKRGFREIPPPFHHMRTQQEGHNLYRIRAHTNHPGTMILDFQSPDL